MTITAELLEELKTDIKRFRVTPEQLAELDGEHQGDEVTIAWQSLTGKPPSVLVTTPAGVDCWAVPLPHRPSWLTALITQHAPEWWMK